MKSSTLKCLGLAAALASPLSSVSAGLHDPRPAVGPSKPIEWFQLDLDKPPRERWTELLEEKKNGTLAVLDYVLGQIPKGLKPLCQKVLDFAEHFWPLEIREELTGMADVLGVDAGFLLAMNLFYELNSGCTSIVAQMQDGSFYHGRNLDYGVPGLQDIAVNVNFTSKGQVVYQGTTYAGYAGLLTGMKPGAFSLSIDERDTKNGTVWDNAFEAIFEGGHSIGFFYRELLQQSKNFDATLPLLQQTHMDSPSYMILGGVAPGEGAIVTRERNVAVDTWRVDADSGRWFLVETNYDHWVPPPADDDRRDPANQHMNKTDRSSFDDKTMLHVMTSFPNLNSETTYTAIMSPAKDVYYSFTQNNNK